MTQSAVKITPALRELAAVEPITVAVQGECMAPLLRGGAKVRVTGRRFYLPGDIVIVLGRDGRLLAHRVIGCYVWAGGLKWLTRADTAPMPDMAVSGRRIIGRVCGGKCDPAISKVPLAHRLRALLRFFTFVLKRLFRLPHTVNHSRRHR